MMRLATAGAAALVAVLGGIGIHEITAAEPAAKPSSKQQESLSAKDKEFMKEAAQAGLAEVQLSQAVLDRVTDAEVKSFAQRMIEDHTKANGKLQSVAQKKNFTLPSGMDEKHKEAKNRLSQLFGYELDRRYMDEMLKDHDKAVSLFDHQAIHGQDADVKKFAEETLPTLRDHLSQARLIDQKLRKTQTTKR